jgi:hypothetical protein
MRFVFCDHKLVKYLRLFIHFVQIQGLLVDKRVTEALELAKNARTTAANKEKFQKVRRE